MDELLATSATAIARAIRRREVSAEAVVDRHLRRIAAVDPSLGAVVHLTAEPARAQAGAADAALALGEPCGPLHGVPFTVKDAFDTAGTVSTAGTRGRAAHIPVEDATGVARLRAAGAILLGKTNLPELSFGFETDNLIHGRANNPYDLSRTPGGSSGGEAAVIAAGGSALGLGSDSGGSLRIPAHFCGIAALKPTAGRVPRTGHYPPALGITGPLWHVGPMARFVEDLALVLPVIAGPDWRDTAVVPAPLGDPDVMDLASLRGAWYTDTGLVRPTADTAEAVRAAAQCLGNAGAGMDEARPAGLERVLEFTTALWAADGGAAVRDWLRLAGTAESDTHAMLRGTLDAMRGAAPPAAAAFAKLAELDAYRSSLLAFMQHYDLIVCPVFSTPAVPHGTVDNHLAAVSYAAVHNLTGWPAVVVRADTAPDGLPIGVQVVARPWREDVALAAARHIEAALGGWRPPPV